MVDRPIGLAILGCGMMGTIRGRVARRNHGVGEIRVFDTDPERTRRLAELIGAEACATAEEAIDHPDVDAVVVSTRPSAHHELAMRAVEAGKPVLVEKPYTKELAQAETLDATAREHGVATFAAYSQRFRTEFIGARKQVVAGSIGDVTGGLVTFYTTKGRGSGRLGREKGASPIANNFPHVADLVLWLMGDDRLAEVTTVTSRGPLGDVPDVQLTAWITLRFASGAVVMTGTSWELPKGYPAYHASIQADLFGTRGVIRIDDSHRQFIVASEGPVLGLYAPDTPDLSVDHVFMGTFPPGDEAFDRFWGCAKDETDAFIECVITGADTHPILPNGPEAVAVRRLIAGVERSLEAGTPIAV